MLTSRPVEVGGVLIGIALAHGDGWGFRSLHPATEPLGDRRFDSRAEVERSARQALSERRAEHPAKPA